MSGICMPDNLNYPTCVVCCTVTKDTLKRPVSNYFGNYLYHQNVRESIDSGVGRGEWRVPVAKLTFSLSLGQQEMKRGDDKGTLLCDKCFEELEQLDKLQKELEVVKGQVEGLVRKIRSRCIGEGSKSGWEGRSTVIVPNLEMSMAGSVIGKENISQALGFLGNLCNGLPQVSSVDSGEEILLTPTGIDDGRKVVEGDMGAIDQDLETDLNIEPFQTEEVNLDSAMKFEIGPENDFPETLKREPEDDEEDIVSKNEATSVSQAILIEDESSLFLDESQEEEDPLSGEEQRIAGTSTGSATDYHLRSSSTHARKHGSKMKCTEPRQFRKNCPHCQKPFMKLGSYKAHVRKCSEAELRKEKNALTCKACGNKFSSKDVLREHVLKFCKWQPGRSKWTAR